MIVDLERPLGAAAVQLEQGQVPGEMAVERSPAVVAGQPVLQKLDAPVIVHGLEADVGDVVAGVGVARILLERALRQAPRFLEPAHLVIGEGQRGLEPPVLAVRGGQTLEKGQAELLAICAPAEADAAAGLVHEQGVARKLHHVLVDEVEPASGLTGDDGGQRLHVLPLAPGCASHEPARPGDGGARRPRVPLEEGEERSARVSEREPLIGRHRRREALISAEAVREEPVHAFLVAFGGDGR